MCLQADNSSSSKLNLSFGEGNFNDHTTEDAKKFRTTTDGTFLDKHLAGGNGPMGKFLNSTTQRMSTNIQATASMYKGTTSFTKSETRQPDIQSKANPRIAFDSLLRKDTLGSHFNDDKSEKTEQFSFGENESPDFGSREKTTPILNFLNKEKPRQEFNVFNETFGSQHFTALNEKTTSYNPFEMDSDRILHEKGNMSKSKSDTGTPTRLTNSGNSKDDRGRSGKKETDEVEWPVSGRSSQMEMGRTKLGSRIDSNTRRSTNSRDRIPKRNTLNRDLNMGEFDADSRQNDSGLSGLRSNLPIAPSYSDNGAINSHREVQHSADRNQAHIRPTARDSTQDIQKRVPSFASLSRPFENHFENQTDIKNHRF